MCAISDLSGVYSCLHSLCTVEILYTENGGIFIIVGKIPGYTYNQSCVNMNNDKFITREPVILILEFRFY